MKGCGKLTCSVNCRLFRQRKNAFLVSFHGRVGRIPSARDIKNLFTRCLVQNRTASLKRGVIAILPQLHWPATLIEKDRLVSIQNILSGKQKDHDRPVEKEYIAISLKALPREDSSVL